MKKKILIAVILSAYSVKSQNRLTFNNTEFFTISTSINPSASLKEKGLDIAGELEYAGFIYAKAGFESFSALHGGYKEGHWGVGVNLTSGLFSQNRFYSGIRTAIVWRGHQGAYRVNYGIEGGIDRNLSRSIFIGIRAAIDKRNDQEIFGWNKEIKFSGFLRIGYKWYYKNTLNN